ncbi:MAG: hypothetical protein J0I09_02080 [Sphingobacteriia bacterium]|nr:hypothetical protein [Sphingobacteriia bacterium]
MQQRKTITAVIVVIIAMMLGSFLKNIKVGFIIGLALGLLANGLLKSN